MVDPKHRPINLNRLFKIRETMTAGINEPWFPPLPSKDGPSEAAKLVPPVGSSLRWLCSQHEDYKYSPLDYAKNEICLIKLAHRKSPDSPIRCTIKTAMLDHQYKALSYVWGTPAVNYILVDEKRFMIRDNLYAFLFTESLNPTCEETWYWIDQLCIDQVNAAERNHQVARMSTTFASAEGGVLI